MSNIFDIEKGKVIKILSKIPGKDVIVVEIHNKEELAINYNQLTGTIHVNDLVLVNTTAVRLNLGTGGYHFVVNNLSIGESKSLDTGHIMKLRYTPYQIKVLAAEEQESPYHEHFNNFVSLNNMPVIVGTLHSMLIPIIATLKYLSPETKVAYIMTDGASLPIYFSDTVHLLKTKGLIDKTITIGHAFGGDIETVNIYNGLIASKEIANCDVTVVSMGPGIVGTGTKYGFTGIEQGYILDVVNYLGGCSIGIPRISFADKRERHKGISHHSLTVFSEITRTRSYIPLYQFEEAQHNIVNEQLEEFDLYKKHNIVIEEENVLTIALSYFGLSVDTMGRKYYDDVTYFLTCSAAGIFTSKKILR